MRVIGYSGLHQNASFRQQNLAQLTARELRIAQGADAAAALVSGAEILAAAAEERFTREKTTGAFPVHAIRYCLEAGGLRPADVDLVAHGFSHDPHQELFTITDFAQKQFDEVYSTDVQRRNLEDYLSGWDWGRKLVRVPHHLAHAASAFFPSGYSDALILVSDGMGEVHSMTVAVGRGTEIEILCQLPARYSLGILYGVFTLYLGFNFGVDEYKVMGLAPWGDAQRYFREVADLVELKTDGTYAIPLFAADHGTLEQETHRGVLRELAARFGPAREPHAEVTARERDLAAALQAVLQRAQLHVLRYFGRSTGQKNLCLAGGVALNCTVNGVIQRSRTFQKLFVQPAAGDDGSALGAALYVAAREHAHFQPQRMSLPLWGPGYADEAVRTVLATRADCRHELFRDQTHLCREVARRLNHGQIIGWFQGRMEFGPRALGNRSILADPRNPGVREKINALIKKREGFRPFAPMAKSEMAARYFDLQPGEEDTFAHMLVVAPVRSEYRAQLPAVTHVDGSARVQTVSREHHPRVWELLDEFERAAGIPILLNTSFNVKGQPIVCSPTEALDTFLSAGLDALVLGDFLITPLAGEAGARARRSASERITVGVG